MKLLIAGAFLGAAMGAGIGGYLAETNAHTRIADEFIANSSAITDKVTTDTTRAAYEARLHDMVARTATDLELRSLFGSKAPFDRTDHGFGIAVVTIDNDTVQSVFDRAHKMIYLNGAKNDDEHQATINRIVRGVYGGRYSHYDNCTFADVSEGAYAYNQDVRALSDQTFDPSVLTGGTKGTTKRDCSKLTF
ncbi:MAG: hypothetical protein KKA05_01615 [Alphaproteobacteria bacterium]|nr:hypothetical protein [Alphaproteobacteria bacterium]MBU0859892.1 hypothetical protein [Alphaproteobacteria bacterium]